VLHFCTACLGAKMFLHYNTDVISVAVIS